MLHIVNKSPLERSTLDSCLAAAQPGAAVLLIEDGVYAATRGNAAESRLRAASARLEIYVIAPDLEARGLSEADMCVPVEVKSAAEIGKLMEEQDVLLSF